MLAPLSTKKRIEDWSSPIHPKWKFIDPRRMTDDSAQCCLGLEKYIYIEEEEHF
jgi:hypothetical protein